MSRRNDYVVNAVQNDELNEKSLQSMRTRITRVKPTMITTPAKYQEVRNPEGPGMGANPELSEELIVCVCSAVALAYGCWDIILFSNSWLWLRMYLSLRSRKSISDG